MFVSPDNFVFSMKKALAAICCEGLKVYMYYKTAAVSRLQIRFLSPQIASSMMRLIMLIMTFTNDKFDISI